MRRQSATEGLEVRICRKNIYAERNGTDLAEGLFYKALRIFIGINGYPIYVKMRRNPCHIRTWMKLQKSGADYGNGGYGYAGI